MSDDILTELKADWMECACYEGSLAVDREVIDRAAAEIERLRAREASLWEALGLLTTLAPRMEIDTSDPMKMARQIEATVRAALKEAQP
jgi:hypothetical protein